MTEVSESTNKGLSRREFLKLAFAGAGALALRGSIPELGETLKPHELLLGALRIYRDSENEDDLKYGVRVMHELQRALQQAPMDLVITPEYSFTLNHGPERKHEPRPLVIQQNGNKFTVDKIRSSGAVRIILENAQSMAQDHRANLFLSSFYEPANEINNSTALFINSRGEIAGVKRKGLPPEGSFEIQRGNQSFKVLPMICGEVWVNMENTSPGEFKAIPPNWVAKGAPYDVFVHTLAQGDLDFNKLAAIAQGREIPTKSQLTHDESWQRAAFESYYGEYLKFLRPNAPILISDLGMAACLNQDLKPTANYYDVGKFVVAKFDTSTSDKTGK